jgi:bacterioferritin-associated ferredoxin
VYVCYCRGLTDSQIAEAISAGLRSPEELATTIGAGKRCGGCWPAVQALLDEARLEAAHP